MLETDIKNELKKLWFDEHFDESNLSEIERILSIKPSYVDFFVRKIESEASQMNTIYLIVLSVIPLETCVRYAIEQDDWLISDFSEYNWFKSENSFKIMTELEYEDWLAIQLIKDSQS